MNRRISKAAAALVLTLTTAFMPFQGTWSAPFMMLSRAEEAGEITATSVNMRSGPGTSYSSYTMLHDGNRVSILYYVTGSDGRTWAKIQYGTQEGYVLSSYVAKRSNQGSAPSDADFESYMSQQGFPETYKPGLRELHAEHPQWVFTAYGTGLDWETVIAEECIIGRSLVERDNISSWKSTEEGAYDWKSGYWPGFDGSTWVAASEQLVRYYMDPRNFLMDRYIYQFMDQTCQSPEDYRDCLEELVEDTFLAGEAVSGGSSSGSSGSVSGPGSQASGPGMSSSSSGGEQSAPGMASADTPETSAGPDGSGSSAPGGSGSVKYTDIILEAASASGVNPCIIAAMILQEQGSQGSGGCVSGSSGYYNFFNIEAYASGNMSATERGIWWASQSGSYGRPWDTQKKAIEGGASWYGDNYVNKGQDTLYLKKFNVTENNRYKHQYMTNTIGAAAEGLLVGRSESLGSRRLVFKIPVYSGMPENPALKPMGDGSPDNRLSGLSAVGFAMEPAFDWNTKNYEVAVDRSVEQIRIEAAAMNGKASVSGTGDMAVGGDSATAAVTVTAENGSTRTYTIRIVKKDNGPVYNSALNQGISSGSGGGSASGPGASSGTVSAGSASGGDNMSAPGSGEAKRQESVKPAAGQDSGTSAAPAGVVSGTSAAGGDNPGGEAARQDGYRVWMVSGPGE